MVNIMMGPEGSGKTKLLDRCSQSGSSARIRQHRLH